MGYDLQIVRGPDYFENPAHQINADEWLQVITEDPELSIYENGCNGPYFAVWKRPGDGEEYWLDWFEGRVFTKNPDDALIEKMLQIALRLHAQVRGDDGEIYRSPTEYRYDDDTSDDV